MKTVYPEYWPLFYTATIQNWKHLLEDDKHKEIIIDSLRFLVNEKRIELNAFVIMSNHIHLIWQPLFGFTPSDIQSAFMKYTAHKFKHSLSKSDATYLNEFKVNKYDRKYQFWKREALSIELISPAVSDQKLEYIHNNPVIAGLCNFPEEYLYSSAEFYHSGTDRFGIITHYIGD